jgi:hypothetical protein
MINKNYKSEYGLINAKIADINAENAPLWSVEYLLLENNPVLFHSLENYIRLCKTDTKGLYNQFPIRYHNKDDYTSPDQLIAFVAFFKMSNLNSEIKDIWKYLINHIGTYDNLTAKTNWSRIMQPAALAFVGACAGSKWAKIALSISCVYSCATKKNETSGKLKAWVMFKTLNMKITEFLCTYFIKKTSFKDWKGIFFEYFQEKEHPIRKILSKK